MPIYKERVCEKCGSTYAPSSPRQKVCFKEDCKKARQRDNERDWEKRKRESETRLVSCLVCSEVFSTTDSRRKYCGLAACELERCKAKNLRAEKKRAGKRGEYKKEYHLENREKLISKQKKYYREVLHPDREVKDGWSTSRLSIEVAREVIEGSGYTLLSTEYVNTHSKLKTVCPAGHEWETSLHSFKDNENRCLTCSSIALGNGYSKPEKELFSFASSLCPDAEPNNRSLIYPFELDIYVPSKKVAIEYCGFYWHSEVAAGKTSDYHYNKMKKCFERGVRLITIFEDEYLKMPEQVKSRIRNALGVPERRIFARKCKVKEIPLEEAVDFLSKNHLQGSSGSRYRFGLFYGDELVEVMTLGPLSRTHTNNIKGGNICELKRFASLPGISVVGGASKLFKHILPRIKSEGYTHVKSYCDMRYGNPFRTIYEVLNFELASYTKYTPHYIKGQERFRNQGLRKTPEERLTGKTEWELRRAESYDRIFDCGHRTYILRIPSSVQIEDKNSNGQEE